MDVVSWFVRMVSVPLSLRLDVVYQCVLMDVVYRCDLMVEVPSCHCVLASVPLSLRWMWFLGLAMVLVLCDT